MKLILYPQHFIFGKYWNFDSDFYPEINQISIKLIKIRPLYSRNYSSGK